MSDFLSAVAALSPVLFGLAVLGVIAWLAEIVLEDREARAALEDAEDWDLNHGGRIPPVATSGGHLFHAPRFRDE